MRKVRIGIAGVAHPHSKSYANALKTLEQADFRAVYDQNPERAKSFSSTYGIRAYSSLDEMLKKENLDAVIIASENIKHAKYAVSAMEAQVHILCEKPIATTIKDLNEMLSTYRKSGVVFQTCFVMRYHTATLTVKDIIDSGVIGDVMAITGTNRLNINSILVEPWFTDKGLSGGGAVMDHTVHLADIMRWLTSKEIKQVYTEIGQNIFPQLRVEDNFFTLLTFEGGLVGSIDGSWCLPDTYPTWGEFSVIAYGTHGMLTLDAFKQNVISIFSRSLDGGVKWHYYSCNADLEMIKDFIKCVIDPSRKPRATIEDGCKGTEVTIASYWSAEKGEPVALPLIQQ